MLNCSGFAYRAQVPAAADVVGQKWGWAASEPGAWAELDLSTQIRRQGGDPAALARVFLAHARSWEERGTASVECVAGCNCSRVVMNNHWSQASTQTALQPIELSWGLVGLVGGCGGGKEGKRCSRSCGNCARQLYLLVPLHSVCVCLIAEPTLGPEHMCLPSAAAEHSCPPSAAVPADLPAPPVPPEGDGGPCGTRRQGFHHHTVHGNRGQRRRSRRQPGAGERAVGPAEVTSGVAPRRAQSPALLPTACCAALCQAPPGLL